MKKTTLLKKNRHFNPSVINSLSSFIFHFIKNGRIIVNIFILVSDKTFKGHKSVSQSQYLCGLDFFFEIQTPFERKLTAVR